MEKKLKNLRKKLEKAHGDALKDVKHYVKYDEEAEADESRGRADAFGEAAAMVKDLINSL